MGDCDVVEDVVVSSLIPVDLAKASLIESRLNVFLGDSATGGFSGEGGG